jgi:hypothetical protein
MESARDFIRANCEIGEKVVLVFLRKKECRIGKRVYSTALYGDRMCDADLIVKGSVSGNSDRAINDADYLNLKLIICVHKGKSSLLPKPVCFGRVKEVRRGTSTRNEYLIEATKAFPESCFERAETTSDGSKHCWVKKQFIRRTGLEQCKGNLMTCFNKCVVI